MAKDEAQGERAKALQAAAAEKQANEQFQKRLIQIEKGNEIITPDDVKKWRAERAKYPEVAPMPRVVK